MKIRVLLSKKSCGKTENENRSSNYIFMVEGKRKAKMEFGIPFSHVVGKRLALRYTRYKVQGKPYFCKICPCANDIVYAWFKDFKPFCTYL